MGKDGTFFQKAVLQFCIKDRFHAVQASVSCSQNLYLYKLLCYVSECSTESLFLPWMSLDHDSGQVMKFVYMWTTCSVSILNKGLILELTLLKQKVFILLSLYLICVEYEFEAFDATSDEIRLMAFYINPDIIVVSLKTSLSTSDEIRRIMKVLCLNYTENEIQTWLSPMDGNPAITPQSVTKKAWKNLTKWRKLCIGVWHISYLFWL